MKKKSSLVLKVSWVVSVPGSGDGGERADQEGDDEINTNEGAVGGGTSTSIV